MRWVLFVSSPLARTIHSLHTHAKFPTDSYESPMFMFSLPPRSHKPNSQLNHPLVVTTCCEHRAPLRTRTKGGSTPTRHNCTNLVYLRRHSFCRPYNFLGYQFGGLSALFVNS